MVSRVLLPAGLVLGAGLSGALVLTGTPVWGGSLALLTAVGGLAGIFLGQDDPPAKAGKASAVEDINGFFNVSLDLLCIIDLEGRLRRVNSSWTKTLGWSEDELLGRPYLDFVHPDDQAETRSEGERLAQGHSTQAFINRYQTKDGGWRILRWVGSFNQARGLVYGIAQDVTEPLATLEELRLTRNNLEAKEEQLRLALLSSGTGIYDWQIPTDHLDLNGNWFSMRGYQPGELPSTMATCTGLMHPDDRPGIMAQLQTLMTGRPGGYRLEYRSQHKDGHWQWIQDRGELVERGPNGEPLRMIGTNIDITELKTTQATLDEARIAAEEAVRAKSDFLATMSHEIRTPMNGVIGLTSVLLGEDLPPAQRETIETIRRSGETLLAILNDILDLAKIESGQMEVHLEPVNASQVLRDALQLFAEQAKQKSLDLAVEMEAAPSEFWLADPLRIRQVVLNLLSNALKFTDHGSVHLRLERRKDRLILGIRDTGVGIPEDRLHRLFQRFSQVDTHSTRRQGGTGLGLAISRHLVELMGGKITVESQPGRGSTFRIILPLVESSSRIRLHQQVIPLPRIRPLRVLVAEDNKINQLVTRKMLDQQGHTVDLAEDGVQAVERWALGGHDLILMDWQMPEMDGLEATRRIRALELEKSCRRIPIIALTANALTEDRSICLAAGMDEMLAKPVTAEELAGTLARIMALADT